MKLQLRFSPDADEPARRAVADQATSLGATAVRPLFPEAEDRLRDLFIVDVRRPADAKRLEKALRAEAAVASVEPELKRRLAA